LRGISRRHIFKRKKQIVRFSSNNQIRSTNIKKIAIIGAGQMGTGVAKVASQTALKQVVLIDNSSVILEKSKKFIEDLLTKDVSKAKATESEKKSTLERLSCSTNLSDIGNGVDFVIEAVPEIYQLKESIFKRLSEITRKDVILGTNTSSISITKIASNVQNDPSRVIGMHFMNPVPVMKLVEIISGLQTSVSTKSTTIQLAEDMQKTCAESRDMPGFIANRLLMPYINEAIYALQESIGSKEDIDKTMKLGCNMPMGPLTLADFIGLDTCLSIMRVLHEELGDAKYRPCPLLVNYVNAGWLGKKVGKGFFEY